MAVADLELKEMNSTSEITWLLDLPAIIGSGLSILLLLLLLLLLFVAISMPSDESAIKTCVLIGLGLLITARLRWPDGVIFSCSPVRTQQQHNVVWLIGFTYDNTAFRCDSPSDRRCLHRSLTEILSLRLIIWPLEV